ncbi:unnamed protein product, partial [Musa textilis]
VRATKHLLQISPIPCPLRSDLPSTIEVFSCSFLPIEVASVVIVLGVLGLGLGLGLGGIGRSTMGLLFVESLPGPKVFKCGRCKVDSASHDAIISKDFHGRDGRAYLFKSV